MGIGADGLQTVFLRQVYIGGAHTVPGFRGQPLHHHILPLPGESPAAAKLREFEGVLPGPEISDFPVQLLLRAAAKLGIVKLHTEVHLVDDLQQVDLKLHGGEQGPLYHHGKLPILAEAGSHILPDGMPQPQKLHIVILDEPDGAEVIQFLPGKAKGAQMVDLRVDLAEHFLGKYHAFIAAFEMVFPAQVGVFMEDDLIHVEFVQVGVQQRDYNGFQFHRDNLLWPVLGGEVNCCLSRCHRRGGY